MPLIVDDLLSMTDDVAVTGLAGAGSIATAVEEDALSGTVRGPGDRSISHTRGRRASDLDGGGARAS